MRDSRLRIPVNLEEPRLLVVFLLLAIILPAMLLARRLEMPSYPRGYNGVSGAPEWLDPDSINNANSPINQPSGVSVIANILGALNSVGSTNQGFTAGMEDVSKASERRRRRGLASAAQIGYRDGEVPEEVTDEGFMGRMFGPRKPSASESFAADYGARKSAQQEAYDRYIQSQIDYHNAQAEDLVAKRKQDSIDSNRKNKSALVKEYNATLTNNPAMAERMRQENPELADYPPAPSDTITPGQERSRTQKRLDKTAKDNPPGSHTKPDYKELDVQRDLAKGRLKRAQTQLDRLSKKINEPGIQSTADDLQAYDQAQADAELAQDDLDEIAKGYDMLRKAGGRVELGNRFDMDIISQPAIADKKKKKGRSYLPPFKQSPAAKVIMGK